MSRSSSGGPAYPAPGSTARCRTRLFRRAPSGLGLRNDRAVPGTASRSLILLLAAACGLIAANVYYAQPLAGSIGPAIGLSPEASGLVVTLT